MLLLLRTRHLSRPREQIVAQCRMTEARDLVDIVCAALTRIETEHLVGMTCNVYIGFVISVKNTPADTTNSLCRRHTDIEDLFALQFVCNRGKIKRRIHFVFIVHCGHKVLFDLFDPARLDAEEFSIIRNSEKNMSTIPIGERTDALIHILREFRS